MKKYNYYEAVKADVITALKDDGYYTLIIREQLEIGASADDVHGALYDAMWTDDGITGNGSGSYWFNYWKAEEALCHNWDLVRDMASEYMTHVTMDEIEPEALDVSIRCYLLDSVLWELVDEILEMAESDEAETEAA